MGRSKFPGKPSKHTNRKRVTVLPSTADSSNSEDSCCMTVESVIENKQDGDKQQDDCESAPSDNNVVNSNVSMKRRLSRKMQTSLRNKPATKRNLLTKLRTKTAMKSKAKLSQKSVRAYKAIPNNCRNPSQKEPNSLVGKFVLPTRSVHSSRVIKPNKRFINVEINESLKKVRNKRHCVKPEEDKNKILKTKKVRKENKSSFKGISESVVEKTACNTGRIVLRQARLKLHTQTPRGPEGPFSSNLNVNTGGSPPGTVTCGVCGAVRFYRFVKQARKFNIYSCESCRKFISKMIKRQTCGKPIGNSSLVCHKGQGMCHVPPIVRSQQWKLIRCAYRARCPACWLKMCLRSFQMPMSLKHSLAQLLPKNMQGPDIVFNNTLPPLLWQAPKTTETIETTSVKQRPVRFKNKTQPTPNNPQVNSDIRRQKIDLKGPRVKHVCRSASIVLGQPIATFTEDKRSDVVIEEEPKAVICDKNNVEVKAVTVSNKSDSNSNYSETESSDSDKLSKIELMFTEASVATVRRERNQTRTQAFLELKLNPDKKRTLCEPQNGISIDFWEGYDPDDICQNGFCLIASERFPMPSICFLCGSGGRESLLYCTACCEPYHIFCLEQTPPINNNNPRQAIWLCPRCTTCSECHQTDRQKVNCQKCSKPYHPECFNKKWNSIDQPTVCSKCLRCKSCGAENITKFLGNLPLCLLCFKLRKKGNFCPICQHCYDENECCSKMMECAKCNKWVHATCEKLTEEQYQILSLLPESIEYFCSSCCQDKAPQWKKAIEYELQANFNQVVRLLSKNKAARDMLKWSPFNNHTPSNKAITNVKKLQFSNEDIDLDNNNYSKEILDVNKIYSFEENEKLENEIANSTLSMVDIKNKLNSNEYCSIRDFNKDMEEALKFTQSEQLLKIYQTIFRTVFPWYGSIRNEESPKRMDLTQDKPQVQLHLDQTPQVDCPILDNRACAFCKVIGDGLSYQESRLLYCGQNEWVHANCALWSSEVYEEIDGSLQNVHSALSRGRLIRCASCKQKGASVGCCFKGCYETYHFICARANKCNFLHDKTVYCPGHELPKNAAQILGTPKEFDIHRSVYVELDKKRMKYSEIDRVNFMVGSLTVTNLGKVHPVVSDGPEVITPMGFACTRLFWSTVEPWKLVPYSISTSMISNNVNTMYVDKNFTVDHSLPKVSVERMLKELTHWQKDMDKKKSEVLEFEDDEEPQNGAADLLSPELTDAILEELPHDLLDGISVQDIFPKLMSYDDLISMDFKSDINSLSLEQLDKKPTDLDEETLDLDAKLGRELRRSKSEIFPNPISKPRSQQRSCSLTVSCKVDSSLSPVMKKRKMVNPRENNMFFQLLQVDGNFDDSSSSECGSPTGTPETDPWGIPMEEPVTCEKCQRTYRTQASYKRHLDTCEIICTSESDSEMVADHDNYEAFVDNSILVKEAQPLMVASYESYQNEIHTSVLNTQTFVTASKSTEFVSVPQGSEMVLQNIPQVEQKGILQSLPVGNVSLTHNSGEVEQTYTVNHHNHHPTITIGEPISISNTQPQFCMNQTVPLCVNQPLTLQSVNPGASLGNSLLNHQTISINQGSISINQLNQPQSLDFQPQSVTIQSVPFSNNVTPILNVAQQNQFTLNGKLITTNPLMQTVNVPGAQWVKSVVKPTMIKTVKTARNRSRTIAAKRNFEETDSNTTIIIPANHGNTPGASVIVQHLPSANFVPFVDAFQQQTGQNVQYVATITPQVNAQPLIQLQPDNNLINLVQPTMIIQQPRLMENQLVLDSNGSLGWAPQPVQPVYYGFETIVQNTVMQSQQFLPTTVPGVLTANSSYSTTTQVFQTSKLEPVLDVASNSFVLVNPGQLVHNSQPIEQYSQAQPQNQSQTQVQVQAQTHQQSHPQAPQTLNIVHHQQPEGKTSQPAIVTVTQSHPQPVKYSAAQAVASHKQVNQVVTVTQAQTTPHTNSISLPIAPFVQEQGIPTNVVTPTPKPPVTTQSRPMSRVLPMPTNTIKECKKILVDETKKIFMEEAKKITQVKAVEKIDLPKIEPKKTIEFDMEELIKPKPIVKPPEKPMEPLKKLPQIQQIQQKPVEKENKTDTSLKLIFQKQGQDGTYKISNNLTKQVAPLKPIKSSTPSSYPLPLSSSDKQNKLEEKLEEKLTPMEIPKTTPNKKENENTTSILYTIETQDGFKYSSTSVADLWDKVLEAVQSARAAHNMPPLPTNSSNLMNNVQILGLKTSGLKYLIEQLPGAAKCNNYKPMFGFPPHAAEIDDEYSTSHPFAAIRCAPFEVRINQPYDMFGWLASIHRKPEEVTISTLDFLPRRGSVINLPMAMKFRQLKLTSKLSVGVYRSSIHGRGLFCLRNIEAGEMVIEYAGEVIRSILTDKREKYYNSKGIGCYMFRVDDNFVVDATMKGNAARFINHSCDPNCYSRVVEILGHKHIIIFALRRIISGEELTYDYKFPFEEDKIPCTCGARKCRKFLN